MMMFGDTKKAITTILSKHDDKGGSVESEALSEKNLDPALEAHMAIAEDLHHAIKGGSVMGIAKAMKAHHDLIKAGTGDGEAEVEK